MYIFVAVLPQLLAIQLKPIIMKKVLFLFSIIICLAILFYPKPSNSNGTGSPGGKTGSPTDGVNCTQCHYAGSGTGATITSNIPSKVVCTKSKPKVKRAGI